MRERDDEIAGGFGMGISAAPWRDDATRESIARTRPNAICRGCNAWPAQVGCYGHCAACYLAAVAPDPHED
jgi:hypothetical protein